MKTPKRNRRRSSVGRMSLEQSIHIANFEATKPNTSTVVEQDEDSEKSNLEESGGSLVSSEEAEKELEAT